MISSSSTAFFASAILCLAGASSGQTQQGSPAQGMNFYVTTMPQTGEQVTPGGASQRSSAPTQSVASANRRPAVNTYLQQNTASRTRGSSRLETSARAASRSSSGASRKAAAAQAQYSIQQVSNSPSAAYAASRRQASTASASRNVVATSAQQIPNYYTTTVPQQNTPTYQQQAIPAYVSNAGGSSAAKPGLFNRILHPTHKTATSSQQTAPHHDSLWSRMKPSKLAGRMQEGMASWYGKDFHGGKTANGERYDMNSMTAAHKSLPFGTLVKVKNERNGRECLVRINNRGPYSHGRIIDLSKAAASALGMINSGVAKVKCEVVGRT